MQKCSNFFNVLISFNLNIVVGTKKNSPIDTFKLMGKITITVLFS